MDVTNINMPNIPIQPTEVPQSQQRTDRIQPAAIGGERPKNPATSNGRVDDNIAVANTSTSNPSQQKDEGIPALDRRLTGNFLQKTIDEVNKRMYNTDRRFSYSVHEKTGQFLVKIIDAETDEVIREIPPEKSLDAVAKMWEMAGIFVDEKN